MDDKVFKDDDVWFLPEDKDIIWFDPKDWIPIVGTCIKENNHDPH